MYKLSKKEKANKPINKLLDNGYRFAMLYPDGRIYKTVHHMYQLSVDKKVYPDFKIVEVKDLLIK